MVFHKARNFGRLIAATVLVLVSSGAYADDTEIFLANPSNLASPNIMLILDTSGSMDSNTISPVPYDPAAHLHRHRRLRQRCQSRLLVHGNSTTSPVRLEQLVLHQLPEVPDALSTTSLGAGGTGAYLGRFVRWRANNNRTGVASGLAQR